MKESLGHKTTNKNDKDGIQNLLGFICFLACFLGNLLQRVNQ